MRLQKTYGIVNPPETAGAKKAPSKGGAALKTPPSAPRQGAIRSVSSLISAAGLPPDKLSASIISFARFFSLPLKPELLKHIRRQVFTMTPNEPSSNPARTAGDNSPEAGTVYKNREALSLAASASEAKGAELQPKGLEAYAKALDPESRQDGGQNGRRGRRDKKDNVNDNDSEEIPSQKTGAISAGSLEKTALEAAEKNRVLAILNRLPEKDGKRWIVLPFDFSDNDREFKVSLRILLETGETVKRAGCMALDIAIRGIIGGGSAVENGGNDKRLLFVLEPANRLSVYLQPEITSARQAALAGRLSALLEISPNRIFIKTKTEFFPFESERGDSLLGSIDEAV